MAVRKARPPQYKNLVNAVRVPKKFYVGSREIAPHVTTGSHPHLCTTEQEAIECAHRWMENQGADVAFVVKVVKVIRRAAQPIVVETAI